MDPKRLKEQEASKSNTGRNNGKASADENHFDVPIIEPPPSYSDAIKNPPYQDVHSSGNQQRVQPSAPTLESTHANSYPSVGFASGPYPQAGVGPNYDWHNDPRYRNWDDNATRILIDNRLRINDRFEQARTQAEKDLLWTIIMNELLCYGYHFSIFDILDFWRIQFYIYSSIISSITSSGAGTTDWQYFQPMHNVFGDHSGAAILGTTTDLGSSSVLSNTPMIVPSTSPLPPLHSTEAIGNSSLPNTDVPIASNLLPTAQLPSTDVASTLVNASTGADNAPLLTSSIADTNLHPVTESLAQVSLVNQVANGTSGNFSSVADALPSSGDTGNILSAGSLNLDLGSAITTQPESFSISKLLDDNVMTAQPTSTMLPALTSTQNSGTAAHHDDDCCFCCCPGGYLGDNTVAGSDDCCGGCCDGNDDGYCCDGNDACCHEDCCDGCAEGCDAMSSAC